MINRNAILKSSFRVLRRNRIRTFFMILGIVISIAALILTLTMGKGVQQQITERAGKYLGSNSIVITAHKMKLEGRPFESDLVSTLTIEDLKSIANEVPSVSMTDPVQMVDGREIIAGNKNISTTVKGSSVNGEIVWNRGVIRGEYFNEAEELGASRVALIGPRIATVLFGNSDPIGETIRIGDVPFVVKGVLVSKGVDPHGNDLDLDVIIPITTMMKRIMNVDYIAMGKVVLNDESRMDEAVSNITAILKERHHITDDSQLDFSLITPVFVRETIGKMTRVFNVFLPLISLIALLAAGIVIVILMYMSVNERVSEIGLRKAVGARSKDILFQFIAEVSATSLVGGIIGIGLGLAAFGIVRMHMQIPFNLPLVLIAGIILLPILVGIVAGIIPARKASKCNPVDALRS